MDATIARCKRCHRPLTDAVSIAAGLGPECRAKHSHNRRHAEKSTGRPYSVGVVVSVKAFTIGQVNGKPIIYSQLPDGQWKNQLTGHIFTAEFVQFHFSEYLQEA